MVVPPGTAESRQQKEPQHGGKELWRKRHLHGFKENKAKDSIKQSHSIVSQSPYVQPVLQIVQITFKNQQGSQTSQSTVADRSRNTVTYHITSPSNRSSVVLFDSKHGFVSYKPAEESACFLKKMEPQDLEHAQLILNVSGYREEQALLQNNKTKYLREFLGILGRRRVNPEGVGHAVQSLCDQIPIYWAKRVTGPGKHRLIYLCIDICFPSNICMSVCFYYLPE
ncbi:BRICHOS domain-containing protein 5 [Rhinatrema bivittatum]|uniref:BRICHOS domain-containing protein 5 n=1 Tax=Rhinatrema bivittatum TaxID=194408 RepID=UPI001128D7EE|nr:BRICHOS domain-containing protein 5 [Rhinatrema bivittatum]